MRVDDAILRALRLGPMYAKDLHVCVRGYLGKIYSRKATAVGIRRLLKAGTIKEDGLKLRSAV